MTITPSQELDDDLAAILDAERRARPVQQWRLPPRPEDYTEAHRIEDERGAELDGMCETDR